MLVLDRATGRVAHHVIRELPDFLRDGDVLVLNDSRVIPARLRGFKYTGGGVELLLVEEVAVNDWWVMLKPGKRVREGTRIRIVGAHATQTTLSGVVTAKNEEGHCRIEFTGVPDIAESLHEFGETPLPPYVQRDASGPTLADSERYQTVFARLPGSVAAPTAGLHFTKRLLDEARRRGARICFVTLHVGLGTFAPVKAARVKDHVMHEERFELPAPTADELNSALRERRRIIAVGTTTVRVLESVAAQDGGALQPVSGRTRIFIHPPFRFRVASALLTNFHLPESTLLMLVSAFAAPGTMAGKELVLAAYAGAVRERYRFFSYGDSMLLL
jgi:S-adenosylmethionine:tRNA ribosyltransferase-isomerase